MDFIIGGAYQGKLDIAKKKFGVSKDEIFECSLDGGGISLGKNELSVGENEYIDFSKRCICHIERFALYCVKNGIEAKDYFEEHKSEWKQSVMICEDIFCGVVPIDSDMRAWREMCGRLCTYLVRESNSVTRAFCGLEQTLK